MPSATPVPRSVSVGVLGLEMMFAASNFRRTRPERRPQMTFSHSPAAAVALDSAPGTQLSWVVRPPVSGAWVAGGAVSLLSSSAACSPLPVPHPRKAPSFPPPSSLACSICAFTEGLSWADPGAVPSASGAAAVCVSRPRWWLSRAEASRMDSRRALGKVAHYHCEAVKLLQVLEIFRIGVFI